MLKKTGFALGLGLALGLCSPAGATMDVPAISPDLTLFPQLLAPNSFTNNNFVKGVRVGSALGLTAAGTTLATALALTSEINEVTTVASGTGVAISAYNATLGGVQRQEVINAGANTLNVWPSASTVAFRTLNGSSAALAAGAATTLAVGSHATFECVSATLCYQGP